WPTRSRRVSTPRRCTKPRGSCGRCGEWGLTSVLARILSQNKDCRTRRTTDDTRIPRRGTRARRQYSHEVSRRFYPSQILRGDQRAPQTEKDKGRRLPGGGAGGPG